MNKLFPSLLIVCLVFLTVGSAYATDGGTKKVKDPYSLSLQALGGGTSTDVSVTIVTVDANLYPIPSAAKQIDIDLKDKVKGLKFEKFSGKDVPLVGGQAMIHLEASLTSLSLDVRVHLKPANSNDVNLRDDVKVVTLPDLRVSSVTAPQTVLEGAQFDVIAAIKEYNGQVGATAAVKLYDGAAQVGAQQSVTVVAGGTASVTFSGLTASGLGTHTYTVTISDSQPDESSTQNNSMQFTITVTGLTAMQVDQVSYSYEKLDEMSDNYVAYGIGLDYIQDTYTEHTTFDFGASVAFPGGVPITSADEISWEITIGGTTFDASSITNPVLNGTNPPDTRNVSAAISTSNGLLSVSLHHDYLFSRTIDTEASPATDVSNGNETYLIAPNSIVSVTVRMRSGANNWIATASISVPAPTLTVLSYHKWYSGTSGEGPNDPIPYHEDWVYQYSVNVPAVGSSSTGSRTIAQKNKVQNPEDLAVATQFGLNQNYPNPFNPSTTISFSLQKAGFVTLKVYDMLAREVATVISQQYPAGEHRISWNAGSLPSGAYIYRITAGDYVAQKKLTLLK